MSEKTTTTAVAPKGRAGVVIAAVALTVAALCAAACVLLGIAVARQQSKLKELENDLMVTNLYASIVLKEHVDTTVSILQAVGSDFAVSIKGIEPYLTGFRIKGMMLNKTSVDYDDVTFSIVVGKSSQEFGIQKLSAGSAKNFEVYVADVDVSDTGQAKIRFKEGNLRYSLQ